MALQVTASERMIDANFLKLAAWKKDFMQKNGRDVGKVGMLTILWPYSPWLYSLWLYFTMAMLTAMAILTMASLTIYGYAYFHAHYHGYTHHGYTYHGYTHYGYTYHGYTYYGCIYYVPKVDIICEPEMLLIARRLGEFDTYQ